MAKFYERQQILCCRIAAHSPNNFRPAALHPAEHLHDASFDRYRTIFKLRMLVQHVRHPNDFH